MVLVHDTSSYCALQHLNNFNGCQLTEWTPNSIANDQREITPKLDLMFMKHYAPNRYLYIKVAKLRTGMGNAETSHL